MEQIRVTKRHRRRSVDFEELETPAAPTVHTEAAQEMLDRIDAIIAR